MKNVFVFLIVALLVISCGSTKEMEETVEDAPLVEKKQPQPQSIDRVKRRGSVDVEQLMAQLGLTEEQEKAFFEMWTTTDEAMQKVRIENRGNKDALIQGMTAVKEQRIEGLERILTDDQLFMYYEIMQKNRGKVDGTVHKRKG